MSINPFATFGSKSNSVANNFSNSLKYNPFSQNNINNSNSINNNPLKTSFNPFNNNNTVNNITNDEKSNNPFTFLSKNNFSQKNNPFAKISIDSNNKSENNLLNFSFCKNDNNNGNNNITNKNNINIFSNNTNKTSNPFQIYNNNNNTNNFNINNSYNNLNSLFSNNNSFFISNNESMDNVHIYNSNLNNINYNTQKINKEKNNLTKTVPLSKILSEHFNNKNNYDEENITKINDERNNLYNNNYNYKDELNNYKRKRKEEEMRRKYEKEREKEYLNNLKILYEKNNKEKIKKLMNKTKNKNYIEYKENHNKIQKEEKNDNLLNNEKENKFKEEKEKINILKEENKNLDKTINNVKIIQEKNKPNIEMKKELNNKEKINKNNFIYEILLSLKNENNEEIFQKILSVDKVDNYELNLDYIFMLCISILNKRKIEYKYGLTFKLGYLNLSEKVGSLNLLNYDILSEINKNEENIIKKLKLEINIIKGNILSEKELCLNPQLFCKLTKDYKITPSINIINKYNLFKYDIGIKIDMKYISIIFNQNKIYDLTFVNFDEFAYNDDTDIFFDKKNFDKENSTLMKLSEKEITLVYKGIKNLYDEKIKDKVIDYLIKRYNSKKYEMIDTDVVIITQIKNLLINEEQSKILYEDFKKNIL